METKLIPKCCPIEKTLSLIGKKWSLQIIRDMFDGKKKFSEFLQTNKDLSTKVLSERLKELQENNIITKKVITTNPISIEYTLTEKGKELKMILYELAKFSIKTYKEELFGKKCDTKECLKDLEKHFRK